jgi:hypothetical protein
MRVSDGISRMLLAMARDEFFQIFAGFRDVLPQGFGGQLGIFSFADSEKFPVGAAGTVEVPRKDEVETSVTIAVNVQGLQEGKHEWTIGGGVESGMETPVPPSPGLHFRILLQRLLVLNEDVFRLLEILFLHVRNRMAQHVAFEHGARLKHLHDLVGRESRDNGAAIGNNGDEPFGRQMAESFTHGNSANLKFGGDSVLAQLFAFPQFPGENFFPKALDDGSRQGLTPDGIRFFRGDCFDC